jgi:hypothetical protein
VLYQMIAGHVPFEAGSFGELLVKLLAEEIELPPAQPGLPPGVKARRDRLLLDLLAKDPNFRPSSMAEVEQRLREIVDDLELPASPKRAAVGSGAGIKPVGERRIGSVDRRRGEPDLRTNPVERRSPTADRRASERDARKPTPPRTSTPPDRTLDSIDTEVEAPPVSAAPATPTPAPDGGTDGQLARVAIQRVVAPGGVLERARKSAAVDQRSDEIMLPRTSTPTSTPAPTPTEPPPNVVVTKMADAAPAPAVPEPVRPPTSRRTLYLAGATLVAAAAVLALVLAREDRSNRAAEPAPPPPVVVPAPTVTPAPAPAPSEPAPPVRAEVKIKFASAPSGARVRLAGSTEVIGTTPFTKTFPREARLQKFEIEMPGYMTVAEEITLDEDGAVATALPLIPRPYTGTTKPPATGSGSDAGSAKLPF